MAEYWVVWALDFIGESKIDGEFELFTGETIQLRPPGENIFMKKGEWDVESAMPE